MGAHLLRVAALAGIGLASTASIAGAQPVAFGYAFLSPMAVTNLGIRAIAFSAGGGAERWVGNGVSVGGEVGVVTFPSVERRSNCCVDSADAGSSVLFSANASRHFGGSDRGTGWRPFATGGLSFVPGALALFNAGGGVDRWMSPHIGLRLEVRDQFFVGGDPIRPGSILLGFRAGLVFH
jgi:hypothetical protein